MPRTPQTEHDKLKHEISKRWPLIGHDMIARAQLEYILQEAGLLAKSRAKRRGKLDGLLRNAPATDEPRPAEGTLNLEPK